MSVSTAHHCLPALSICSHSSDAMADDNLTGKKRRLEDENAADSESSDAYKARIRRMLEHLPQEALIDILASM